MIASFWTIVALGLFPLACLFPLPAPFFFATTTKPPCKLDFCRSLFRTCFLPSCLAMSLLLPAAESSLPWHDGKIADSVDDSCRTLCHAWHVTKEDSITVCATVLLKLFPATSIASLPSATRSFHAFLFSASTSQIPCTAKCSSGSKYRASLTE